MKLYGRRRQYQRLRRVSSSPSRKKFVWKVKANPRVWRVRLSKSMVVLRRFRDSYVEMMLCFAGRVMQLNHGNVHLVKMNARL